MRSKLEDKLSDKKVVEFDYNNQHYVDRESDLQVMEMTPETVRIALNHAPKKYAYWANILSDIDDILEKKKTSFEFWKASKFKRISDEFPKATATYVNNQIMLDFPEEYKAKWKDIREIEYAKTKCAILVKAYEMQSRTLQSVGSLFKSEMGMSGVE